MKKGRFLLIIIGIILFTALLIRFEIIPKDFLILTGKSLFEGVINLFVEGIHYVYIHSPENTTYYFAIGQDYSILLNVSANFNATSWWYDLYDLRHNTLVRANISFNNLENFNAVRWSNRLVVYANDSRGNVAQNEVVFFVSVPNSAPVIGPFDLNQLACEKAYYHYLFNATDIDEDYLSFNLNPRNPFFIFEFGHINLTTERAELYSGLLTKVWAINLPVTRTVTVDDGFLSDYRNFNITVIEINNPPSVENIGVRTVWTHGDNSTFNHEVQVNDLEDGNQSSGNFIFNLTFINHEPLFNISSYGIMQFTPNSGQVGVYNLSLCVNDRPLSNPHPNISLCGQNGSGHQVCQNFSLTVTDENRKPTIVNYYPLNLTLRNLSGTNFYFNITKYDPDGTIPDAYWYVDGKLMQYNSGSSYDNFSYVFGCMSYGPHYIKVIITDGLLTDELIWNIEITDNTPCPIFAPQIGPGAEGETKCIPKWACSEWDVCAGLNSGLETGLISGQDYRDMLIKCGLNFLTEENCGYQERYCFDIYNCSSSMGRPQELQFCEYVKEPSCQDNVKNCHDGACEVLTDCGGPCAPCPTCTDHLQNQGEFGIDCGGPCPWKCPPEAPWKGILWKWLKYLLWLIILALMLVLLIKIVKIIKIKKEITKYNGK